MVYHLLISTFLMSTLHAASVPGLLGVTVRDIDGLDTTLGAAKPKAVLVVNVASECGYTRQYAGLQSLYETYKSKGLIVAGFPSNDFGGQEPGSEAQIKKFCSAEFKVTFPMYAKVAIKGAVHPLFEKLTSKAEGHPGPVTWNFNKFLIGVDGKLLARFGSDVEPDSAELAKAIEKALK
jgi:glutathione peroxidase